MLRIIKSNQPIPVNQITVTIYSLPGIGKSSLAFTAGKVLLFDTDKGSYRAANRGDVVSPVNWGEIATLDASDLAPYDVIALDTAGRALDMLSNYILQNDPKMGRKSGDLSLQGFGALKSSFTQWLKRLHGFGKDVILLSHMDEKMEGDIIKERLDIQGGSKAEIYKSSDAMAKLYIEGKNRRLDFSPREGSLGKNPAQFDVLTVPNFAVEPHYFAKVLADIKGALNKLSEEQKAEADSLEGWRILVHACKNAADFNALLPKARTAADTVKMLIMADATEKGIKFDREAKQFYAPSVPVDEPKAPEPPATPPEAEKPSESNPGAKAGHPVRPSSPASTNGTSGSVSGKTQETFLRPTQTIEPLADVQTGLEEVDAEIREVTVKDVEQRRKGGRVYMLLSCTVAGHEGIQPIICWHKNSMFDHLSKSMGKVCKFGVVREEKGDEVFYNLEEIHSIGDQVFVDNKPALTAAQLGFGR